MEDSYFDFDADDYDRIIPTKQNNSCRKEGR
jgi:hypothetical protein